MIAGAGSWMKKNYDRILAAAMLLVLLGSLLFLAVTAQVQKAAQAEFDRERASMTPKFATALPADKTIFKDAIALMAAPVQSEEWTLSLLTPEVRVSCTNCDRPIPYNATNCTFAICGAEQPAIEPTGNKDVNGNGIPDEWEKKYDLFSLNSDDVKGDPDDDGFSTKEEYEWQTNPKDAASHPPYVAKERVKAIHAIAFKMVFKAVSKAGGSQIFQINLRSGGRTYWAKLGEAVGEKKELFKVVSYDDHAAEGPTLTLERSGKKIPLIKGKVVPRDDYEVRLISLIDQTELTVRPDVDFDLKGSTYRVKKVDIAGKRVLVNDPSRDVDVWIEQYIPETVTEPKPPST